jgi:hypothetical protein
MVITEGESAGESTARLIHSADSDEEIFTARAEPSIFIGMGTTVIPRDASMSHKSEQTGVDQTLEWRGMPVGSEARDGCLI